MPKLQHEYPHPDCVTLFERDSDAHYAGQDPTAWYGTAASARKFREHVENMLPFAEAGDPSAQYAVALAYWVLLVYETEEEAMERHPNDAPIYTRWLELAARQGHIGALDNLLGVGVGPEAERLRALHKVTFGENGAASPPTDAWRQEMCEFYEIAYGRCVSG